MVSINQLNNKAREESHTTDQLAGCSKHTLCITMGLFLRKSYEAGAELLTRRSRDFLTVHLAVIEQNGFCPVRHTHSMYFHLTAVLPSKLKHPNLMLSTTILGLICQI